MQGPLGGHGPDAFGPLPRGEQPGAHRVEFGTALARDSIAGVLGYELLTGKLAPTPGQPPGPGQKQQDPSGKQTPVQVARVPALSRQLDPQGRHKHLQGEQARHYAGRDAEDE